MLECLGITGYPCDDRHTAILIKSNKVFTTTEVGLLVCVACFDGGLNVQTVITIECIFIVRTFDKAQQISAVYLILFWKNNKNFI